MSFLAVDYDCALPAEVIASHSAPARDQARMMVLDRKHLSISHRDAETPFRQGSMGEVCLFTHQIAKLNAARPSPSALLTTASQARHAPRLAPYVDAHARPLDEPELASVTRFAYISNRGSTWNVPRSCTYIKSKPWIRLLCQR